MGQGTFKSNLEPFEFPSGWRDLPAVMSDSSPLSIAANRALALATSCG